MSPTNAVGSARFRGVEGRAGSWVLGALVVVLAVLLVAVGLVLGSRSSSTLVTLFAIVAYLFTPFPFLSSISFPFLLPPL